MSVLPAGRLFETGANTTRTVTQLSPVHAELLTISLSDLAQPRQKLDSDLLEELCVRLLCSVREQIRPLHEIRHDVRQGLGLYGLPRLLCGPARPPRRAQGSERHHQRDGA